MIYSTKSDQFFSLSILKANITEMVSKYKDVTQSLIKYLQEQRIETLDFETFLTEKNFDFSRKSSMCFNQNNFQSFQKSIKFNQTLTLNFQIELDKEIKEDELFQAQ